METQVKLQKKWYKKWWAIVAGGFIGIVVLGFISAKGMPVLRDVPTEVKRSELELNGFGVEANASVKIYLNGNLTSETKADNDGNFSTPIVLVEGKNSLYVTANYKDEEKKSSKKIVTYINQEKIDAQNEAEVEVSEFQNIQGFRGYKSAKSPEFYIKNTEAKFVYSCKEGLVVCTVWLRSTEGNIPKEILHSSGSTGEASGEIILTIEPGIYYLEADTRDRNYDVQVYQKPLNP